MAQQPKVPQEPSSFIEAPRNSSKDGLFMRKPSSEMENVTDDTVNQVLAKRQSTAPKTYIDEIGDDPQMASAILRHDPAVKEDIVRIAKSVNGVDLSGKTQEEVADWLLNERRTELGSLAMTATEFAKTRGLGGEDAERYARLKHLYDRLPNFDGGVGQTLWSVGKAAVAEAAVSGGAGAVANLGAKGLMAGNALMRGAGIGLQTTSKYVLLGSASSDAAKTAAAKAIAQGATQRQAAWSAAKAGAIREAPAGAIWEGGITAADQGIRVNAGMQEEVDNWEVAGGAALGSVLGPAAIGLPVHGVAGAIDASKYAKKLGEINSRAIDVYNPAPLATTYDNALSNQKALLEEEIRAIGNTTDPVELKRLAILTDDLVDVESQIAGARSLDMYPSQRKAMLDDIKNKATSEEIDVIINGVNELDTAFTKALAARNVDEVADAYAKFGSQYNITGGSLLERLRQPTTPDIQTRQPAAEQAQSAAQPEPQAAQTETQAAQSSAQTAEQPSADAETPEQSLAADAAAARKDLEPQAGTASEDVDAQSAASAQAEEAAAQAAQQTDNVDELLAALKNSVGESPIEPSRSTPQSTAPDADAAEPSSIPSGSEANKAETPKPKRQTKKSLVNRLSNELGIDEKSADAQLSKHVKENHPKGSRPTIKDLEAYTEQLIASVKRPALAGAQEQVIEVQKLVDAIIQDMADNKSILPPDVILESVEGYLDQLAPNLPPKVRELALDSIRGHIIARTNAIIDDMVAQTLLDMEAGIPIDQDLVAEFTRILDRDLPAAIEGAVVDKITYNIDDYTKDLTPAMRSAVEPELKKFVRKLASQIKKDFSHLSPGQQGAALRVLAIKKAHNLASSMPAHNVRAKDTPLSAIITEGSETVSGRNQSKDVTGRVTLGDTQNVLKEATGGQGITDYTWIDRGGESYSPRTSRSDGGRIVGAIESARRAIYRAATAKAGKGSGRLVAVKDANGKPVMEQRPLKQVRVGHAVEGKTFIETVVMDTYGNIHFRKSGDNWYNNKSEPVSADKITGTIEAPKLRYVERGPRVAESAVLREITPEVSLARDEGNVTQYILIDNATKQKLSDVTRNEARDIELFIATENYISKFAPPINGKPQTPEQAFMKVVDTINKRYGGKVSEDELRSMMRSIINGENIFSKPKSKAPKSDKIELASVLPDSINKITDKKEASRLARAVAISRASIAFKNEQLTREQLISKLAEIHSLTDDEVLEAAYKKINADTQPTRDQKAAAIVAKENLKSGSTSLFDPTANPSKRIVTSEDLDLLPKDIKTPSGHVAVLRDSKGRIRKLEAGVSLRDKFGEEALGWEIGAASAKHLRHPAKMAASFKNLADVDVSPSELRINEMSEIQIFEADIEALTPNASRLISEAAGKSQLTLRHVFDVMTSLESAPWQRTYAEFQSFLDDYRSVANLYANKTAGRVVRLHSVHRNTARKQIDSIFSTSHPTDLVYLHQLLSNLGGDQLWAPAIVRSQTDGSHHILPSQTGFDIRENSIVIGDAEGPLRAFSFTHELAHWGFRNILSVEDRIKFFELMDNYYKARTGELSIDSVDAILPDLVSNRLESPQELFANQFTQWLFSTNPVFGGQQYAKSVFEDAAAESVIKGFARKFKEAVKRIVYGKATTKSGADIDAVDEDYIQFFEQIMSSTDVRPSRAEIKAEELVNPKSQYYLNMMTRLDERRARLEVAIQSFNPVALNEAIKDSLMFLRWMMKNSRTIRMHSRDGNSYLKVSTDESIINTIVEYHKRQESFEELPDFVRTTADDVARVEDPEYSESFSADFDEELDAPQFENYTAEADLYTQNADLVGEQQKAAMRLQNAIEFAISKSLQRLKSMEKQRVSPAVTEGTDLSSILAEVEIEAKAPPAKTDRRTSKKLRDDIRYALERNDIDEINHIADNLEYRGAPKLHFNKKAVTEEVERTLQPDGTLNRDLPRVTPQERELLGSINHRDPLVAQQMRQLATNILTFHAVGRNKIITNADLAKIIGEESADLADATTRSPEFIKFRDYVKKRYEALNLIRTSPKTTPGDKTDRFAEVESTFLNKQVGDSFISLFNSEQPVTIGSLAEFASKNRESINPTYVILLHRISQLDYVNDIRVERVSQTKMTEQSGNNRAAGAFFHRARNGDNTPNSFIYIDETYGNAGDQFSVMMHEVIHAATLEFIEKNAPARLKLNKLYKEVKEYTDLYGLTEGHYGMASPTEFIAEALTNGEFQNLLDNIIMKDGNQKTALVKLIEFIAEILGVQPDSALRRALAVGDQLFMANKGAKTDIDRELQRELMRFREEISFVARDLQRAYEPPKGVERIIPEDRLPPILVGALEEEIGRPVFIRTRDNKLLAAKTPTYPTTRVGRELKALDAKLHQTYTRIKDAADPEVKSILKERFSLYLNERTAVARQSGIDPSELYADPVAVEADSIFRVDDKFEYARDELVWLANSIDPDSVASFRQLPEIVTGAQLKSMYGEEAIADALREKGIGLASFGADANELTIIKAKLDKAQPSIKVDRINYASGEQTPSIPASVPFVKTGRTGQSFSAIANLAQQQGAPLEVVSAMKKVWTGKTFNADERSAVQKLFDFTKENSEKLRNAFGMRYIADFIKPEEGVGVNEIHASELAKKVVPVFNKLHKLKDASNPISRWARKSNPLAQRSSQPASHKRLIEALRRGDMFALESSEEREIFVEIQTLFEAELKQMREDGIQVGDVKRSPGINGYMPQVWDADAISENPNAFIEGMANWFVRDARRQGDLINIDDARERARVLMNRLSEDHNGVVGHAFDYASTIGDSFLSRTLRLTTEDLDSLGLEKFMVNDLEGLLAKYFDATTRRRLFHKKWGIKDHAFNAYKQTLIDGKKAVVDSLTGSKSFITERVGIMPDGTVGTIRDEVPFMPAAISSIEEANQEAINLYRIADTKPRSIAIPEIESSILKHYSRFAESGFYPEMQKRAAAIANAIVDSRDAVISQDTVNFLDNVYASSQNKLLVHGAGAASAAARKASGAIRTFNSITMLAYTTLASFSDPVIAMMRGGNMTAWAKAMREYAQVPEYREATRRMGATINSMLHERLAHVYGDDSSKLATAFFHATLLTPWTMRMRELATIIGFEALRADAELAQRLIVNNNTNSRAFRMAKKRLDYYGLGKYAQPGAKPVGDILSVEEDDAWRYALMKFDNETIFEPNNNDVPIWAQTPIGKMVYQLKSFPHMMARTVMRSFTQNELERFVLPFLVAGPAAGMVSVSARDIIQSRGGEDERSPELRKRRISNSFSQLDFLSDDVDAALGWYMEGMLAFGGLGLFAELIYSAAESTDNGAYGFQRMSSAVLGPWIGTANNAYNIMGAVFNEATGGEKAGPTRAGLRSAANMIPIAGGNRAFRESVADIKPLNKRGGSATPQSGWGITAFDIQPISPAEPQDITPFNIQPFGATDEK